MSTREQDDRLDKLRAEGKKLYSISRLNTMEQCQYQAYMRYVEKKPQKNIGIYGALGECCHSLIEDCIHDENKSPSELKDIINNKLDDLEITGVEFPKDRNGGTSIRDNWLNNIVRFSEEFATPQGNFETEQLLFYKVDEDHYMMGYADAICHQDDGSVWLIDWKTSSQFDKAHLLSAGRQLVLYKLALEELGYTVSKCSWCMLKYCETSWTLKNGKTKTKVSEWRNLIKDMKNNIEKDLDALGYDEMDIEIMLDKGITSNSWSSFPQEVQDKYTTAVYYRDYEITDEIIEETKSYINRIIGQYESLGEDGNNYSPCNIDKNSYFCNALCGYGGKSCQCKYYADYCDQFSKDDNEEDLF